MQQAKRFIVDVHSSYTVEADAPDSALRAVLPIAANADDVKFEVREVATGSEKHTDTSVEPYAHLAKSTYKVNEVAEILGLSRSLVYEKVPCIRVGARRLYPRATIVDILQHGLKAEEPPIRLVEARWREAPRKSPKIITAAKASATADSHGKADDSKTLTMKDAVKLLGVSYSTAKELFVSRKVYSVVNYGKRIILRQAVEHFLKGGSAREYVEGLIQCAKDHVRLHVHDRAPSVLHFIAPIRCVEGLGRFTEQHRFVRRKHDGAHFRHGRYWPLFWVSTAID